jgi:hypothetical protein
LGYAEAWEFDIDQLALWERSGCLPDSRDAVKDGRRRTVRQGRESSFAMLEGEGNTSLQIEYNCQCRSTKMWGQIYGDVLKLFFSGDYGARSRSTQIVYANSRRSKAKRPMSYF